jgi:glycosyltransferase involved in cell wall biosynthesis
LLGRLLASLAEADAPDETWEVLVVDNGSSDLTREVAGSFAARLPLRTVVEPDPGLANARNAAIAAATGQYLVWTDDDCVSGPGWARAYAEAARRWPDAAFFGGPIRPVFDPPPPRWLQRALPHVETAYAARDAADGAAMTSTHDDLPFGANMAIRAAEQRVHLFDPALGRRPGPFLLGEDTRVLRSILRAGGHGVWVGEAAVGHVVGPDRQTVDYLWSYFVSAGRTLGTLRARGLDLDRHRLEVAARRSRRRFAALYRVAPPSVWGPALRKAAVAAGRLEAVSAGVVSAGVVSAGS